MKLPRSEYRKIQKTKAANTIMAKIFQKNIMNGPVVEKQPILQTTK